MDIIAEQLVKEYDGKQVLNLEHMAVEQSSLCGIIGANGAGKSTLLNIIAGLEPQTSGRVFYGKNRSDHVPLDVMTMVFQTPYILSTTVEKNIAYPLKLRGWCKEKIEERVTELTEELGLTEFRKRKGWKLSGGETQKVALARALSFHPQLLLLDEPTANIDPGTTAEIETMLKKINREEGTTVIIITHNLAQAKRLCSDILFMDHGQAIEFGIAEQVLRRPLEEMTRKFVAGELIT